MDEAKKMDHAVLRAQVVELRAALRRAIELGRDAIKYSYNNRDGAQENLDELAALEKVIVVERFTEQQLDEIERDVLTPYRQITMPTMRARQMLEEIRDLRDQVCILQMKIDGSRAVVDAVGAAARADADTKLSAIQIERPNGPPFYLVDALLAVGGEP